MAKFMEIQASQEWVQPWHKTLSMIPVWHTYIGHVLVARDRPSRKYYSLEAAVHGVRKRRRIPWMRDKKKVRYY